MILSITFNDKLKLSYVEKLPMNDFMISFDRNTVEICSGKNNNFVLDNLFPFFMATDTETDPDIDTDNSIVACGSFKRALN